MLLFTNQCHLIQIDTCEINRFYQIKTRIIDFHSTPLKSHYENLRYENSGRYSSI